MSTVVLKSTLVAEEVMKGTVCPLCGHRKTRGRSTCRDCYNQHGGGTYAADAVKEVVEGLENAEKVRTEFQDRQSYFPRPILAQRRIGKGAEVRRIGPDQRLSIRDTVSVAGGFMEVWYFGAAISEEFIGKGVTALFELKRNAAGKFYLRGEVTLGAKSDVRLAIQPGQGEGNLLEHLPSRWCAWEITINQGKPTEQEKELDATVGFLPA